MPPGIGKSHLALALGVEAIKAGKSVYFITLGELVSVPSKAERRPHDKLPRKSEIVAKNAVQPQYTTRYQRTN
jgi:DNA replication protein DnaC